MVLLALLPLLSLTVQRQSAVFEITFGTGSELHISTSLLTDTDKDFCLIILSLKVNRGCVEMLRKKEGNSSSLVFFGGVTNYCNKVVMIQMVISLRGE